jgi:hypothetical protein
MSYRRIATRPVAAWALVTSATRLPNAMAPLALVFLGHGSVGGYAEGSLLAAIFIAGEVAGAAVLGTMLHPRRLRANLAAGLAVGASGFAFIALAPDNPVAMLATAAFVAGAGPALSPGALRTILTGIVSEEDVPRAFSADSVLTELLWMLAPALVVVLALQVGASTPLALCAVCMATASVSSFLLKSVKTNDTKKNVARPPLRLVMSAWPIYVTSAAAMSLMAVSELVLPALLQYRNHPVGLSGILLTIFAALSALVAFLYGLRSWPGTARIQSLIFLVATTACIAVVATIPNLTGIVVFFLAAGCFQPVVLITRNLSLRQQLPEHAHTAGYSVMYAVQGIGYSISAIFAAVALDRSTPSTAILVGVAITLLLAGISVLAERRAIQVPEPVTEARSDQSPGVSR